MSLLDAAVVREGHAGPEGHLLLGEVRVQTYSPDALADGPASGDDAVAGQGLVVHLPTVAAS